MGATWKLRSMARLKSEALTGTPVEYTRPGRNWKV